MRGKHPDNDIILYDEQDENLWDPDLIEQGTHFLNLSAQGDVLSSYHLEAGIAFWNCQKEDTKEKAGIYFTSLRFITGNKLFAGCGLKQGICFV